MGEEKKPQKPKTNLSMMFGEYTVIDKDEDAYIAYLKDVESNETVRKVVYNPVVNIYITKPEFRIHNGKKEWSTKKELDEYSTRYLHRGETIWNALNNDGPGSRWRHMEYVNLRQQMSSPYVYGADIDIGPRMKNRFQQLNGDRKPVDFKVGSLDIETDVNGTNQIILITFMNHDGNTYVGILKEFFKDHTTEEVQRMWDKEVEPDFVSKLNPKIQKIYKEADPVKLHLQIFNDEVTLIKWIFDNVHLCKPDFITIWNMGYDIPYILDRLAFRQVDPKSIFCDQDLDPKFQVCKYHHDKGKEGDHITDHWDVFHLTSCTRYIDAMCAYGRIRKAKPREPSYKLDAIGGKELGTGKLSFGDNGDHHTMQLYHQVEYTVYNIVDVLILRCLELKNHDMRTMMMLIGQSMIDDFSRQSVQLKNMFYVHLDEIDGIPASVGEQLTTPWDKYITNKGGQVLSPDRTRGTGVSILIESLIESFVHKLVCDIDVSSMYPSLMKALNCTKETKLCTILHIMAAKNGKPLAKSVPVTIEQIDKIPEIAAALVTYNNEKLKKDVREAAMEFMAERIQKFLYKSIYIESNAVLLGEEMLGLPGYEEIDQLIEQDLAIEQH